MGSPSGNSSSSGSVETFGPHSQHQLAGTAGHTPGPPAILPPSNGKTCSRFNRQCGSKSPCQQGGRNTILGTDAGSIGTSSVGRIKFGFHQGGTHFRGGKSPGGLPEQSHSGPCGMAPGSGSVRGDLKEVRSTAPGPICHPKEHTTTQVLLQIPDTGNGGNRRSPMSVAGATPVRLSTTPIDTGNHTQVDPGRCRSSLDCSALATTSVVCRPCGSLDITPVEDSPGPSDPQSGQTLTSRPSVAATSRLALERQSLARQSFSPGVISIIQASRRPSTNRIYDATWKGFCRWCSIHHLDPLSVTIPNILDYLLEGLNKGLSYSTIRRQLAALSTVLSCDNSSPLSQHPAISAFLKGAVNTRPPVVHRYPSWNLTKVLQALTSTPFEPLNTCSLHQLSLKVAFLVAITSARRISELAALSVRKDLCTFFRDKVVLRPDPAFIPKVNTIFHRSQELVLPNFCPKPKHRLEHRWHKLDVRRALCYYVKRTSSFRKSEALFVSFQPSTMGKKVSSSTIGRWIRACIAQAYVSQSIPVPPHVTAHSTRSASTSAAWSTQASVEEICRAATWSSPSVFVKHYRVDSFAAADAAFGRRVLQQVFSAQDPVA